MVRSLLVALVVASSGRTPTALPCGPTTCTGCCSAAGVCLQGADTSSCGRSGASCARFTLVEQRPLAGRPTACSAGDLDDDGFVELVVMTLDPSLELFRGTGPGGLAPLTSVPALKSETPPAFGDLDRDGRPELVVPSSLADGGVFVVRALPDGGLTPALRLQPGPSSAAAVVLADVDGDGLGDVVGVGGGSTFVMHNRCR